MSDEMEEIKSEFITEAEESLDKIEPLFIELEQKGQDNNLLDEIFRSMHTIKGAAGFLALQAIVDVAHASENILKKVREGEIVLSKPLMDAILKSVDMLRLLLQHLKAKDGVEEDTASLVTELKDALNNAQSGSNHLIPPNPPLEKGGSSDSTLLPKEGRGDFEMPAPVPSPEDTVQTSEDVVPPPEDTARPPKDVVQTSKDTVQTLRVDIDRIDKVMDLAGEVVLARNRLLNISNYLEQRDSDDSHVGGLLETVSFLDRVTSDMQLAVMKMRMQPIQKVFSKFPRLVRDMSSAVKKDVELQIFGKDTEVDKSVIEHIGDPMSHLLRNSIDHGIESAEERSAKGKPAKGKIIINTYQKGNQIVIEISDDGKGIDIDKLKKKAVEKSLITEDEVQRMSDEAAIDIIFLPGFSTAQVATELSGRGVGMDVVKTNISRLNGYVEVTTQKDIGTTFRISIPLTLAIIQSLMVDVAGTRYAIPLSPIEETLKVSMQDINNITGQDVINIRDRVCPLFDLNGLLGISSNGGSNSEHRYVVVVSMGDKRFCIGVDKLLGQEEVVIKALDGIDTDSAYVLGATITGDGKIVLILDLAGMSRNLLGIAKI